VEVGVWLQFAELMPEVRAQGVSKIIPEASLIKATETEGLRRRWGRFHRELPGMHDGVMLSGEPVFECHNVPEIGSPLVGGWFSGCGGKASSRHA
jgi:hypothetical protein